MKNGPTMGASPPNDKVANDLAETIRSQFKDIDHLLLKYRQKQTIA